MAETIGRGRVKELTERKVPTAAGLVQAERRVRLWHDLKKPRQYRGLWSWTH